MKKPTKKKPVSALDARELFNEDMKVSIDAIYEYMKSKGYEWDRALEMYVDDGSLEAEWADRVDDERKGN